MRILAWDTSGKSQSMAIWEDGQILAERFHEKPEAHTQELIPSLNEMLNACDLGLEQMDLLAATVGPGSFTGVRIGLSTLKALSFSLGKKVVGVSTLRALAEPLLAEGRLIFPVLDARMQEIYASGFKSSPEGQEPEVLLSEGPRGLQELIDLLGEIPGEKWFLGSALAAYPRLVAEVPGGKRVEVEAAQEIRGSSVAQVAYRQYKLGKFGIGEYCLPNYLRPSQAEKNLVGGKSK